MNVLYEAIASLHRQVDERIADDATTPCLLSFDRARAVLDALLAYTAQPEQEPVAHVYLFEPNGRPRVAWDNAKDIKIGDKLYTAPPQRKPLMDEEILTYRHMIDWTAEWSYIDFARAVEAAHGIKGEA